MPDLDTRDKRASAIGYKLPGAGPLPNPDGSVDDGNRAHVVGEYPGIAAGGAAAAVGGEYIVIYRRRRRSA